MRRTFARMETIDHVKTIERDGVLVIPDFLSERQFSLVREEFERARNKFELGEFRNVTNGRLKVSKYFVSDGEEEFKYMREFLQENQFIQHIASATIRRLIASKPIMVISVFRQNDSGLDNDIENILHADLHTSTVKAFFYLNDIDESNGAFIYAKGSHRLSFNRIRHEYDMSVRTAKLRRGDSDIPESLLATRGPNKRNLISGEYMRKLKVVETQFAGKANTLLIANNMGFHRRGEFYGERSRETILLNFRHLEHPF